MYNTCAEPLYLQLKRIASEQFRRRRRCESALGARGFFRDLTTSVYSRSTSGLLACPRR